MMGVGGCKLTDNTLTGEKGYYIYIWKHSVRNEPLNGQG